MTPRTRTEAIVKPPSLAPGVTRMALGAAGLVAVGGRLDQYPLSKTDCNSAVATTQQKLGP